VASTPREIVERFSRSVILKPGLSKEQLSAFAAQLPGPLPIEVTDLLTYSAGFEIELARLLKPDQINVDRTVPVLFRGSGALGLEFLPYAVDLVGDECGNFWVVDVSPRGEWGPVIFVCHDPPVIAIQAHDLAGFVSQLLEPEQAEVLRYVHDQAVTQIWKDDPWLMSAQDAKLSGDKVIREFANQLSEKFCVADLRSRKVGSGFSWGKAGADAEVKRDGSDLVFGVERKASSFLNRLLSRR
jgi:hypothetical protein